MKKIPSLFLRDYDSGKLTREVNPEANWVMEAQGVATRKYDGTCCLVRDGVLFKRYEVKKGKTPPPDFEAAVDVDPNTGKQQGWVPVGDGPEDQYHREAVAPNSVVNCGLLDGTYELCGPKVQGNLENLTLHMLYRHDAAEELEPGLDYDDLAEWLAENDVEGIVWHHPDGRMAKIKGKDFGVKRPAGVKQDA